jgi:hypothetical protein
MRQPSSKNYGQVILEVLIVFLCIAVLAIASTRVFSNLNLNMLTRLDVYRKSRIDAVNNPTKLAAKFLPTWKIYGSIYKMTPLSEATVFLDYSPYTNTTAYLPSVEPIDIIPELPDVPTGLLFFQDPNVSAGNLALEKMSLILNLVLPYKVNQAYFYKEHVSLSPDATNCSQCQWEPLSYISKIKNLAGEGSTLAGEAYNELCNAINYYKTALYTPAIPGSFDPNPGAHPELYGLDPADPNYEQGLQALIDQHNANRDNLKSMIDSLEGVKSPLEDYLTIIAEGIQDSPFKGLTYVKNYIGSKYCHFQVDSQCMAQCMQYSHNTQYCLGECSDFDCHATQYHETAVTTISYAKDCVGDVPVPCILSSALRSKINTLNSLLASALTYAQAQNALTQAENIYNNCLSAYGENVEITEVAKSLKDNLAAAIESWDDDPNSRDDYINLSQEEIWALAEVAEATT